MQITKVERVHIYFYMISYANQFRQPHFAPKLLDKLRMQIPAKPSWQKLHSSIRSSTLHIKISEFYLMKDKKASWTEIQFSENNLRYDVEANSHDYHRRTIPKVSCPFKPALAWSGSDSLFIERSLPINPSEFPRPQHNFENILSGMARTLKHVDLQQRL